HHQKILRDLQTQLNGMIDPIASLPFEISSDIFMRCLPLGERRRSKNDAPFSLRNVCRSWANIALSTPSLW
ncbi:hypothetical protein B0H14DRAFT_2237116, partial [Mycena olivaceomarginata]